MNECSHLFRGSVMFVLAGIMAILLAGVAIELSGSVDGDDDASDDEEAAL